jgi:hypothetical protein
MHTALRATSQTLAAVIGRRLAEVPDLAPLFGPGGNMVVSLATPDELETIGDQGVSLWLYRLVRDENLINRPPRRVGFDTLQRRPLPVRCHYLVTPIIEAATASAAETEQTILGRILQCFYDQPFLRGVDLQNDFAGTSVELTARLEPLSLEEITRVWDALDRSYQLCLSYEVTVVEIDAAREPEQASPVEIVLPEYGTMRRQAS